MLLPSLRKRLLKQRRFRAVLVSLLLFAVVLGMLIVPIESRTGNIRNLNDGLWWAASTLTAVGYGDHFPVTVQGRIIGVLLQIAGALTFGLLIAIIGSSMNRSQEEYYWNRLFERINGIDSELSSLRKKLDFVVKEQEAQQVTSERVISTDETPTVIVSEMMIETPSITTTVSADDISALSDALKSVSSSSSRMVDY